MTVSRTRLQAIALLAAVAAAPAGAATRNFGITGFEKVRIEGPFKVRLTTGVAPFASASGSRAAIDRVAIEVRGNTLVVQPLADFGAASGLGANQRGVAAHLQRIWDTGSVFGSGFTALNPNGKIPALEDRSGPAPFRVFESGAILLHLAEKFDFLLPRESPARAEVLSWLMWQMGTAPFVGGGFGHFYAYAPSKMEYPINRFAMEVKRQLDVLDRRLAETEYLAGGAYTVADIAAWPWYGGLAKGWLYEAAEFLAGGRMLGEDTGQEVAIDPAAVAGLDLRLR